MKSSCFWCCVELKQPGSGWGKRTILARKSLLCSEFWYWQCLLSTWRHTSHSGKLELLKWTLFSELSSWSSRPSSSSVHLLPACPTNTEYASIRSKLTGTNSIETYMFQLCKMILYVWPVESGIVRTKLISDQFKWSAQEVELGTYNRNGSVAVMHSDITKSPLKSFVPPELNIYFCIVLMHHCSGPISPSKIVMKPRISFIC